MTDKVSFAQAKKEHMKALRRYVPVVARVHGERHPEFHEVRRLYEEMVTRISAAGRGRPDLAAVFEALRQVTNGYRVPKDVCESYEAVYRMLSELDRAYRQ